MRVWRRLEGISTIGLERSLPVSQKDPVSCETPPTILSTCYALQRNVQHFLSFDRAQSSRRRRPGRRGHLIGLGPKPAIESRSGDIQRSAGGRSPDIHRGQLVPVTIFTFTRRFTHLGMATFQIGENGSLLNRRSHFQYPFRTPAEKGHIEDLNNPINAL